MTGDVGVNIPAGSLVVISSSYIFSKAITPAIYLGVDPSNQDKMHFVAIANPRAHPSSPHQQLVAVASKSAQVLSLDWKHGNGEYTQAIYELHDKIKAGELDINFDEILKYYENPIT